MYSFCIEYMYVSNVTGVEKKKKKKKNFPTSAGRSLGFSLSMFVSDICNQTSNISDYGVEV